METLTIQYQKLFQVELLLHHLLDGSNQVFDAMTNEEKLKKISRYDLWQWMEINPTATCQQILKGHGWVFKRTFTGFLVATAVHETAANIYKPAILPSDGISLDFGVYIINAAVAEAAALPMPAKSSGLSKVYLFDNKMAHEDDIPFPQLSLKAPLFLLAETYLPGDLVRNQGKLFQAKKKSTNISTSDIDNWVEVTENMIYASSANIVEPSVSGVSKNAFALVRIQLANNLDSYSLLENGVLKTPKFEIRVKKFVE